MVKIIDNFLSESVFRQVQQTLMSDGFPWYFNDGILYHGEKGKYQFTHSFFTQDGLKHDYYNSIEPCLHELGATTLLRVKANLNPKTLFHRNTGWHVDFTNQPPLKTSVFYINSNNGWTKFKDGCKVKCVENRMVIFDSNIEHAGFTCTNQKRKVVVNFNYGTN